MTFKQFFQSKTFRWILSGIGALILLLLAFQSGVWVGYRKAGFAYRLGDNYYQMFGGRHKGFWGGFHDDFAPSHGAIGKIIKIDLPTIVIEGQDSVEKIISIDDDTIIRRMRTAIAPNDLKVDDTVVVVGSPTDTGGIKAQLIRLMPQPIQNQTPVSMPAGTTSTLTQ